MKYLIVGIDVSRSSIAACFMLEKPSNPRDDYLGACHFCDKYKYSKKLGRNFELFLGKIGENNHVFISGD